MLDLRVTYEVKPLFHNREPGRTSYRVIRRVTIGNSDVATMEIARYAHEHDAQIVASRLRLSAHDEEHDHYPSAEEEVDVVAFASEGRTAPGERFEGHGERECGEHRTTGPRAWCFDCQEWCYLDIPCRGCELPLLRARAEKAEAALQRVRQLQEHRPEPGPTLSELAERVERLAERVQGLAETNNLWDGS